MKSKYILGLAALTLLAACGEGIYEGVDTSDIKYSETPVALSVNPSPYYFDAAEGSGSFELVSGNAWEMKNSAPGWLTASPTSGSGDPELSAEYIAISATANTEVGTRTAILDISTTSGPFPMAIQETVIQYGQSASFKLTGSYTFGATGGRVNFPMETNIPLDKLSVRTDATGCSATVLDATTLQITVGENLSTSSRRMTFYVYAGEEAVTSFEISQFPMAYQAWSSMSLSGEGQTLVNDRFWCNIDWKLTAEDSWLTFSPSEGKGSDNLPDLTVKAEPNTTGSRRETVCKLIAANSGEVLTQWTAYQEPYALSANPKQISGIEAAGGDYKTTVASPDAWSVESMPEWVTVSPSEGKAGTTEVTLTCTANGTGAVRTGTVWLRANGAGLNIELSQNRFGDSMTFEEYIPGTSVPATGASYRAHMTASTDWTTDNGRNVAWITVDPMSGPAGEQDVTVNIAPVDSRSGRNAILYITKAGDSSTVLLSQLFNQQGVQPSLTVPEGDIPATGGHITARFFSPSAWSMTTGYSDVTVTPSSGEGMAQNAEGTAGIDLDVYVGPNLSTYRRSIKLTYTIDGSNTTEWIYQAGAAINVGEVTGVIDASGEHGVTIPLNAGLAWTATTAADWAIITPDHGPAGETAVIVTASPYSSTADRSTNIYFTLDDLSSVSRYVSVTQSGLQNSGEAIVYNAPCTEISSAELDVPFTDAWTATSYIDWITVETPSGSGSDKLVLSIAANPGENSRTGAVRVQTASALQNYSIVQQGRYIKVQTTAGEMPSKASSIEVYLNATVEPSATVEYLGEQTDWLTVTKAEAGSEATAAFRLTTTQNNSVNARMADVVFSGDGVTGVKFRVTQSGRQLKVSPAKMSVSADATLTDYVSIEADGGYSISSDAEWAVVEQGANSNFRLNVAENTTGSTRTANVKVALTGTLDGEVRVVNFVLTQTNSHINVSVGEYGPDENWN